MKVLKTHTQYTVSVSFHELEMLRNLVFESYKTTEDTHPTKELQTNLLRDLNRMLGYLSSKERADLLEANSTQ